MEIFTVKSMHSGSIYKLIILPIKNTNQYKIINLTKGHISKCTFNSYQEAVNDIYNYEKQNKNIILKKEIIDIL